MLTKSPGVAKGLYGAGKFLEDNPDAIAQRLQAGGLGAAGGYVAPANSDEERQRNALLGAGAGLALGKMARERQRVDVNEMETREANTTPPDERALV